MRTVTHQSSLEPVFQRWLLRLWVAMGFLSLVLPIYAQSGAPGSAAPGLGVSRAALQAVFAGREFAFTFDVSQDRRGVPLVSGTVPGKLIALILVGPPEDLTEVTLMLGVPSTDPLAPPAAPAVLAENVRYLRSTLQHALPDWKEGLKWLNTQLQSSDERVEVGIRQRHREIVLLAVNHWSVVLLSIRAGQPPAPQSP
jgi:hypothetical protein